MTPTFRFAALAALALCAASPARADWTGTMKLHIEPAEPHAPGDQQGVISGKGARLRFEMDQTAMGKVAAIVDLKAQKSTMVMVDRRVYMTMDLSQNPSGRAAPVHIKCEVDDGATCLLKNGFAKTGVETVNGKKSDKWEKDSVQESGKKVHETLWIPQGVKGFALVRQVTQMPERTATLDVLDLKETSLADSLFTPPADYTDVSGKMGPGGPGGRPQ